MIRTLTWLLVALAVRSSIYDRYYADAQKITDAMTLEQKIGQIIQADFYAITTKGVTDPNDALSLNLGSLLVGGNGAAGVNGNMATLPELVIQEQKTKDVYKNATLQNWQALTKKFSSIGPQVTTADKKVYKIKLLLATDAVHNDQHVLGTVLFPHNIGLSCSHNSQNFYNLGYWTANSLKKSGFNYAFGPTVAVSHNPQWGRYYQTMGQQENYILLYGREFVKGLQNVDNTTGKINGVLGSVKHFMADGATLYGANQGDARVYSFKNFITHNVQGYKGAIESEVGTVMASYSAINDIPMSLNSYYLQNLLRTDLGFGGFVISDYNQVDFINQIQLPTSFVNMTIEQASATMLNGGIDMFMMGQNKGNIERLIKNIKKTLSDGELFVSRLDDAVTKVIAVKMAMGLVENVKAQTEEEAPQDHQQATKTPEQIHGTNEYLDSLQAVRESLVLLKNDNNLLPVKTLTTNLQYVVLVGEKIFSIFRSTKLELFRSYDNIGMQSGGWSVRWQGFQGNDFWTGSNKVQANASSILDALTGLRKRNNFTLVYPNYTVFTDEVRIDAERNTYLNELKNIRKNMTARNTLIIGVIGEAPYAETLGDRNIPYCLNIDGNQEGCLYNPSINAYATSSQEKNLNVEYASFDMEVINSVRSVDSKIPLVTVMFSGRPMIVDAAMNISNAFISAWLPGTSGGQGVVDAISGDYLIRPNGKADRTNTLSMDWPANMDSLKNFPIYYPDGAVPRVPNPLFEVGYGLSTAVNATVQSSEQIVA